ncbi:ribonuclease Z [Anaerolentibacter hominis]|uniref:ribonuclease Z n=1 Tax=Anaerolentibacter hominis TaxID=3079009 RepID=UPI0031B87E8C
MLDVCLLGTGGMMPLPGRWLTALMTRCNGSGLLIDCGEGTQIAIREHGWSFHDIDVICFTHFHADHVSGLPGLLLSMGNAARTQPVTVIGPKGLERMVGALRVIAPELPFELKFIELTGPEQTICINDYQIEAFRVQHNVTCYGYSVVIPRAGRFSVEKADENQVPKRCWSKLQKGEIIELDGRTFTPDMVLGPPRKGLKLTYCTDSRPVRTIAEHAEGADLFICEGMYGEKEAAQKAMERRHMTFLEAADLAKTAGVSQMWLTHYSPSLVWPGNFIEETRKVFPDTRLGKDGMTTVLEFEKDQ